MSTAARSDLDRRVHAAQLRRLGLTAAAYADALAAAARCWAGRFRWLPRPLAVRLFPLLGRRYAARFIEAAAKQGGD